MLTSFCCGYAIGMATVGVAIILVDNYLNGNLSKAKEKLTIPKADVILPKLEAKIESKVKAKLERESKPKALVEVKPVKENNPKIETVSFEEFFLDEPEEEYTVAEILAEFL